MNIPTYELMIPGMTREIERRATRARHGLPARPARWSAARWFRARWAVMGTANTADSRHQRPVP